MIKYTTGTAYMTENERQAAIRSADEIDIDEAKKVIEEAIQKHNRQSEHKIKPVSEQRLSKTLKTAESFDVTARTDTLGAEPFSRCDISIRFPDRSCFWVTNEMSSYYMNPQEPLPETFVMPECDSFHFLTSVSETQRLCHNVTTIKLADPRTEVPYFLLFPNLETVEYNGKTINYNRISEKEDDREDGYVDVAKNFIAMGIPENRREEFIKDFDVSTADISDYQQNVTFDECKKRGK